MSTNTNTPTAEIPDHVFELGDTIQVRHLKDAPEMVVKEKIMGQGPRGNKVLDQIQAFWFSKSGEYWERPFKHLDLKIIARARDTKNR